MNADAFLDSIKPFIPQISLEFKEICDAKISLQELENALQALSSDKSPGSDGLTANFYKFFWDSIKFLLFKALTEVTECLSLSHTMKQGVIILIPKPGKDPKILDNLRPITLLNNDYKLLAHIYSNRLKSGLSQIISNTQSGFMRGRSSHNNLLLVQDLIDYKNKITDDGIMFFLDFYKAFDTVEHPFIFSALELFGFGKRFRSIISSLYWDTDCSVSLIEGTTSRFNISRGIKLGCPISPLLFILAAEMLALAIKNSDIEQLKIFDDSIVISQLADDTVLFLKNIDQVPNY
ncbi:MAG: RNA-directed DNA polymerase [Metamycoplasmataceae bacterium]